MQNELQRNPDLDLIGRPQTLLSCHPGGQYWESFEGLGAGPASERFCGHGGPSTGVCDNGTVGILNETIRLTDAAVETLYGNMPAFGLVAAVSAVHAGRRLGRA